MPSAKAGAEAGPLPGFADKRAFLESGAPWPDEPPPDCIETHASIVCLTRDRAWKLKKPVRLVHIDQRALEDRERFCREELRLNRELAGEVYRGLTPLVQRADGGLALGGEGVVIDWVIETLRLPADEMLDRRLAAGPAPTTEEIAVLAEVLLGFYGRQPRLRRAGDVFWRRLTRDAALSVRHLREMAALAGIAPSDRTLDYATRAVEQARGEILERAARGELIEGHGDLRAEHVCLTRPPVVFDRLEIDGALRRLDPFFEVNALGLECGLLGGGWIRAQLLARLAQAFAPPSEQLLSIFGVVACVTRARIAADHFRDAEVAKPEKYRAAARAYLKLAADLVDAAQDR
ncbi:hypothetical protein [Jannaschia seohaensis]|uniref:Aminoglycoside phosphotransferase family enzyme n=1 Tax=Jannaschia seohaensis TaxID=475081 RepID=A0A2Y9AKU4_9RHOB|nr:hypothetical protein [Jannaschia seohaensis]PWJ20570.1 aminoglycoside phosphotransferase family enzyme [Jannaschia seohaensis]SSA44666.1 Aminoglycoside phosphotransferase family enzyme [Jannaschia seohaensis]